MTYGTPARTTIHRTQVRRRRVTALLVAIAAIAALLGHQLPGSPSPTASSSPTAPPPAGVVRIERPRALGDDGLDPALRDALRRAAADAAYDGVELIIRSGRRSPERQQQLLDEAVAKYGSREEAARWVAPPDRSAHVSGDAVDIGPAAAAAWLSRRGAEYGLCQVYGNEPWHFELRPDATAQGCPPMYPDPTHDPRLQR